MQPVSFWLLTSSACESTTELVYLAADSYGGIAVHAYQRLGMAIPCAANLLPLHQSNNRTPADPGVSCLHTELRRQAASREVNQDWTKQTKAGHAAVLLLLSRHLKVVLETHVLTTDGQHGGQQEVVAQQ